MKQFKIFITLIYLFLNHFAKGQIINSELLIKNVFLMENVLRLDSDNVSVTEYIESFDFNMRKIGNDYLYTDSINFIVLDSFQIHNSKIFKDNYFKDSVYVVAVDNGKLYRLKGFSYNDFPFLLKLYLDQLEDYSINRILHRMNRACNYNGIVNVDFKCLYDAFRSKEINYDLFPCLESYVHSTNISVVMGYNEKTCIKIGGEPIGYRGKKNKKSKYLKQY